MKIFVANLPYYVTTDGVMALFGLFGRINSSKIGDVKNNLAVFAAAGMSIFLPFGEYLKELY